MGHADNKLAGYTRLRSLLIRHADGISRADILAQLSDLELNPSTIFRWLQECGARRLRNGVYTLDPTPEDIELARAIVERVGQ